MRIEEYSRRHRQFELQELPPLLAEVARPGVLADLGCGDGTVLAALERRGLVEGSFAVDLSPTRVAAAEQAVPGTIGIVASASQSTLAEASVDGVVCSQVIEHMPDQERLASEIARILRPGGWWYVGTVLRRPRAWWIYKVDGVRRLDPTHLREYESPGQLLAVLADPGLAVGDTRVGRLPFPLSDLALRTLARLGLLSPDALASYYRKHPRLRGLRRLAFSPPGYCMLEVAGHRL